MTNVTSVGFFDPTGVLPLNGLMAQVGIDLTGVPFPPDVAIDFIPYNNLTLQNSSRFVGVDLMKSIRFEPEHHGGVWELFFGPRFFQFHDRFLAAGSEAMEQLATDQATARSYSPAPPNIVSIARVLTAPSAPNFWDMGIDNNLVGPQIGARWSMERERWTVSADFRAMIGGEFSERAFKRGHKCGIDVTYHPSGHRRDDTGHITGVGVLGQPYSISTAPITT